MHPPPVDQIVEALRSEPSVIAVMRRLKIGARTWGKLLDDERVSEAVGELRERVRRTERDAKIAGRLGEVAKLRGELQRDLPRLYHGDVALREGKILHAVRSLRALRYTEEI